MPVRGGTLRQAHGRRSKHRGHGARTLALTASMLGAGLLVAACGSNSSSTATTAASGGGSTPTTAASGGGTANGVDSLLNGVSKSSGATFSATYLTVEASTGKSQTVTFAQSPPKSAITTASASFYIDGTAITECQGSGSSPTCTTLPSTMTDVVSALTDLYSPANIVNDLKGVQAQAAAHSAGYVIGTSTATHGGLASRCVTVKATAQPNPVIYCGSTAYGVLTYLNASGNTITLQSYSANPPASTFAPPAGATVQTLPAGA